MELQGAVAIVTGSSSVTGIGAETAKGLAARGARVVVNYATNEAGAKETAGSCAAAGVRSHSAKRSPAGLLITKSARRTGSGPDSPSTAIFATLPVTTSGHLGKLG